METRKPDTSKHLKAEVIYLVYHLEGGFTLLYKNKK